MYGAKPSANGVAAPLICLGARPPAGALGFARGPTRTTCKSCGACARSRNAVIGFPAHGAWRQAEKATASLDVSVGASWAFHDHPTMAEVMAAEAQMA
jgi:hypothetical protein